MKFHAWKEKLRCACSEQGSPPFPSIPHQTPPFPPLPPATKLPPPCPPPGALTFNIKRGGILYGTVEEGGKVKVDFIYEPPQQGNATNLEMQR